MKIRYQLGTATMVALVGFGLALSAHAQTTNVLVNDTWRDGDRTDPAAPVYAENNGVTGTDADGDGDLESAWFHAGSGTLAVVTNNPPITGPNILELNNNTGSSASMYTYFTAGGTAVTLSAPGDELKLTWVFTPSGVPGQNGSGNGFVLALGLTPSGLRNSADGSIAVANYTNAFGAFMNMGTTFGATAMRLTKWATAGANNFLGTSGAWNTSLASGGASLTTGYQNGTQYTYTMDLTMTASGLQVKESMAGDNLAGTGAVNLSYLDASLAGQSVGYDTFDIRPANNTSAAAVFDTSLFQVEKITTVPEPSTVALIAMGLGLLGGVIRRRRS